VKPAFVLCLGVTLACPAFSQTPIQRSLCVNDAAICRETVGAPVFVACDGGVWMNYAGRSAFGPLRNVGPIRIEVEARPIGPPLASEPLYFEIHRGPVGEQCVGPGVVIWQTYGTSSCDSTFVRSPAITLPYIGLQEEYWIQVYSFYGGPGPGGRYAIGSPAWRCLRVGPVESMAIERLNWTGLKQLFR